MSISFGTLARAGLGICDHFSIMLLIILSEVLGRIRDAFGRKVLNIFINNPPDFLKYNKYPSVKFVIGIIVPKNGKIIQAQLIKYF